MIKITYGEDTGFIEKTMELEEAFLALKDITDEQNLFIDGELIEDVSTVSGSDLQEASFIIIHEKIIGA